MNKIISSISLIIPPCLVIFGYGGMVCYDKNGSLHRINKSFDNIPR